MICNSCLLSPKRTLYINAASLAASSFVHLWYPGEKEREREKDTQFTIHLEEELIRHKYNFICSPRNNFGNS